MKSKNIIETIAFYLFLIFSIGAISLVVSVNERKSSEKEMYGIHIKGEVNAPGYYELPEGSRYKDAIIAAGGETSDANLETINLATLILDGEEIFVLSKTNSSSNAAEKTNINTADLYKLCKLDGIGEKTAQNIIDYRSKKGPFVKIKDLLKVNGIGEEKLKSIEDLITVE